MSDLVLLASCVVSAIVGGLIGFCVGYGAGHERAAAAMTRARERSER